ncbi:LADA_0G03444g1_1 [Lachancea dasiensis]|uniref:LADA_0G03444g1_1 n=1 Tax=Lachancea dasiensis TaxID=1072105 RepID=A0A1G4JRX8_9SACH|nr:LADA_0G03444g1_1 [Lachancea dasiensis]
MSDLIEPDFDDLLATPELASDGNGLHGRSGPRVGRGTLDESIAATLKRDVLQINSRLKQVVYPHFPLRQLRGRSDPESMMPENTSGPISSLQDHCADLWAPLLFTISYSVALSRASEQFSSFFVLAWSAISIMAVHLTLIKPPQSQKNGGNLPLLAAISTCGYCLFPHVLNAVLSALLFPLFTAAVLKEDWRFRTLTILRVVTFAIFSFWSLNSALKATRVTGRTDRFPLVLVLVVLSWPCVVS